jgi:anaphase-promoting complex subunit 8
MSLDESSIFSPSRLLLDATLASSASSASSSSLLLETPVPGGGRRELPFSSTFQNNDDDDDEEEEDSTSMSISGMVDTPLGSTAAGAAAAARPSPRRRSRGRPSTNGGGGADDDDADGGRSRGATTETRAANGRNGRGSAKKTDGGGSSSSSSTTAAAANGGGGGGGDRPPPPRRRLHRPPPSSPSSSSAAGGGGGADDRGSRRGGGGAEDRPDDDDDGGGGGGDDDPRCSARRWDLEDARAHLRRASGECARRGLKLACRWASEQLVGLAPPRRRPRPRPPRGGGAASDPDDDVDDASSSSSSSLSREEGCVPTDVETYASSLFDLGEYGRAAHALSSPSARDGGGGASASNPAAVAASSSAGRIDPARSDLTPFGTYLRAHSLYLDGERSREERVSEMRDPLERGSARNPNLPRLEAELRAACERGDLDAFGMYVYGAVLRGARGTGVVPPRPGGGGGGGGGGDAAHRMFVRSILLYPYNWSAWLDLGDLCVADPSIDEEVEDLLRPISDHWMYHFFCVHVFIENKANENAIVVIEKLANGIGDANGDDGGDGGPSSSGFFVQSAYLQSQLAMAYYDVRDYDSAHEHFVALSEREPYRLDHMDAFSNVLYVKDQKVALSHLAHRSMTVDKYRPETCVVVGNYYSSRARHEKAVQYFQRALKLDRTYLSAWTLLGHEYIEMKNTAAAIEAYRRAVDISDREYRAWYGLGQTYEIMNMLLHALFYFRKAAALHPHDARMWCAIGGCLLGLDRRADAERSYERAVSLGDGEGIATRKLAELYREDGDEERAAKCYLRHLELRYLSQLPGAYSGVTADSSPDAFEAVVMNVRVDEPEAEALLYLAHYYRDNLEYDQAILCATRLEDYPGPEKEQGKSLLRDIRSRMDQKAGERGVQGRSLSVSPPTPALGLRRRSASAAAESSFEFSP